MSDSDREVIALELHFPLSFSYSFVKMKVLCFLVGQAAAFSSHKFPLQTRSSSSRVLLLAADDGWIDLTDNGGVQKQVLVEGGKDPYETGTEVSYFYKGTLVNADWTAEEVVSCWLAEQQGIDDSLPDKFCSMEVDERKLTNIDEFTESFVQEELGVTGKIACKKLVMASKRLATSRNEFPPGMEFDSSDRYEYTIGSGKLIRGMELGLASMRPGEEALVKIRSDYAYGSEGYRKRDGDVVVPPFASLLFEIKIN